MVVAIFYFPHRFVGVLCVQARDSGVYSSGFSRDKFVRRSKIRRSKIPNYPDLVVPRCLHHTKRSNLSYRDFVSSTRLVLQHGIKG